MALPPPRYTWDPQPHHKTNKQKDWMALSLTLFNIDTLDLILPPISKLAALTLLAEELAPGQHINSVTTRCELTCSGKSAFNSIEMYAALLEYQLKPPSHWYESGDMRRCLGQLEYLENCANGLHDYSKNGFEAILPVGIPVDLGKPNQGISDQSAQSDEPEAGSHNVLLPTTPRKKTAQNARPLTRSISGFLSTPPASSSESAPQTPNRAATPATPTPRRKRASRPRKTPVKKTDPKKPAAKRSTNADKKTGELAVFSTATPLACQNQQQSPMSDHLIARLLHTAPMLEKIAFYEDVGLRKLSLEQFTADLGAAGWNDLQKAVDQLVSDTDHESRSFLANLVTAKVNERINLIVNNTLTT